MVKQKNSFNILRTNLVTTRFQHGPSTPLHVLMACTEFDVLLLFAILKLPSISYLDEGL